jgi:hypothetical protein
MSPAESPQSGDTSGAEKHAESTGAEDTRQTPPAASADRVAGWSSPTCPLCGHLLLAIHCKLICEDCGYREDCSDLFPI